MGNMTPQISHVLLPWKPRGLPTLPLVFAHGFRNLSSQTTKKEDNFCSTFTAKAIRLKFTYFFKSLPLFSHSHLLWAIIKTNSDMVSKGWSSCKAFLKNTETSKINRNRQAKKMILIDGVEIVILCMLNVCTVAAKQWIVSIENHRGALDCACAYIYW